MSLPKKYHRALSLLEGLDPEGHHRLERICRSIRHAQRGLMVAASGFMEDCTHRCQGLCCRNINPTHVIDMFDLQCILVCRADLADELQRRTAAAPLFSGPCVFLKAGRGPCIFPADLKPRVCVTTFCQDDSPLKTELRQVDRAFARLYRFWRFRRLPLGMQRWLAYPFGQSLFGR